jgi:hypothetical protein
MTERRPHQFAPVHGLPLFFGEFDHDGLLSGIVPTRKGDSKTLTSGRFLFLCAFRARTAIVWVRPFERTGSARNSQPCFNPISSAAKAAGEYMKRFMISVVMVVAVGLGVSLTAQTSQAAEHDLRIGSFEGVWCNLPARFDITKKIGNTWTFEGKIWIKSTGQYDSITIVQYKDNNLRIVRHLSGSHAGQNQWADTHPPETVFRNGRFYVNFPGRSVAGVGSGGTAYLLMPKQ